MTGDRTHQELRTLLGAFVLNAVSPFEYRRVEKHLETCEDCAREVRLLGGASTELAWLPPPEETDELVSRIASSLPFRSRRILSRVMAGAAAVSIALAGTFAAAYIHQRDRNSQLSDVLASATRAVTLQPQSGFAGTGVLHLAANKAVLVLEHAPPPGHDRSYQLWAVTGLKPKSMAVVGGSGRIVALFDWHGSAERYALTIEPLGGSPIPTTSPVLLGN